MLEFYFKITNKALFLLNAGYPAHTFSKTRKITIASENFYHLILSYTFYILVPFIQ